MARILVVDDEMDMRMALATILSRSGHSVFEAEDGKTALAFLSRQKADLVLLDIRMPVMDGIQVLKRLRKTDKTTPVIMVTGYGSVESAVEVMNLGASHYLAKPFRNKELLDTVARVLHESANPGVPYVPKEEPPRPEPAPSEPPPAEPAPRADKSSWKLPALLLAGAAAALSLWAVLSGPGSGEVRVPGENPVALLWRGGSLWSADWVTATVYEGEVSGRELRVSRATPLPQTHIAGLAVADGHLYLSDPWTKTIQKRRLDEDLSLVATYKSPGPKPTGLFYDGRYLWSADAGTRRFYQHQLDGALTVLSSYEAPGRSPAAVYKDEDYFWSADAETRLLYKHRLDNRLRVLETYSLRELDPGSEPLSCFTLRGDEVWIGRDGSDELIVRKLGELVRGRPGEAP